MPSVRPQKAQPLQFAGAQEKGSAEALHTIYSAMAENEDRKAERQHLHDIAENIRRMLALEEGKQVRRNDSRYPPALAIPP